MPSSRKKHGRKSGGDDPRVVSALQNLGQHHEINHLLGAEQPKRRLGSSSSAATVTHDSRQRPALSADDDGQSISKRQRLDLNASQPSHTSTPETPLSLLLPTPRDGAPSSTAALFTKEEFDRWLAEKIAKAKQEAKQEANRGPTVEESRAHLNTLLLSICPAQLNLPSSRSVGGIKPLKHLPKVMKFDTVMDKLCKLVPRLLHLAFGQESYTSDPRSFTDQYLKKLRLEDGRQDAATLLHKWKMTGADITIHLVVALGSKFRDRQNLSPACQECFRELTDILETLKDADHWPTEKMLGTDVATPDEELQKSITSVINPPHNKTVQGSSGRQEVPRATKDESSMQSATKSTKNTTSYSSHRTDLYFSYTRDTPHRPNDKRTVGMIEFKAFNCTTAKHLWDWFNKYQQGRDDITDSVFRPRVDAKASASISQSFSYTITEGCSSISFSNGAFQLFLWIDFPSQTVHYYCIHGQAYSYAYIAPEDRGKLDLNGLEKAEKQGPWKPSDSLSASVAALLRGIDDCNKLEREERKQQALQLWHGSKSAYVMGLVSLKKADRTQADKQKSSDSGCKLDSTAGLPKEDPDDHDPSGRDQHRGGGGGSSGRGQSGAAGANGRTRMVTRSQSGASCGGSGGAQGTQRSSTTKQDKPVDEPSENGDASFGSEDSSIAASNRLFESIAVDQGSPSSSTSTLIKDGDEHKDHPVKVAEVDIDDDGEGVDARPRGRYLGRSDRLITAEFCSERCMVSLKLDQDMDRDCPNFALHYRPAANMQQNEEESTLIKHAIGVEQVVEQLEQHLKKDHITHIMEPILGCRGSTSQLFRVVHPEYGYAFAAKGVDDSQTDLLEQEEARYKVIWEKVGRRKGYPLLGTFMPNDDAHGPDDGERGDRIGIATPISFGIIRPTPEELDVMYPLWPIDGNVDEDETRCCNTFLLLSYHGNSLLHRQVRQEVKERLSTVLSGKFGKTQDNSRSSGGDSDIRSESSEVSKAHPLLMLGKACEEALDSIGVEHNDVHYRNLLWSDHLNSVVVIDFGGRDPF